MQVEIIRRADKTWQLRLDHAAMKALACMVHSEMASGRGDMGGEKERAACNALLAKIVKVENLSLL